MKIKSQYSNRLVLGGVPGGMVWVVVMVLIGLGMTIGMLWFGNILRHESVSRFHSGMIAMGIGLIIAQVIFWIGVVTLVVGKLTLTLDLVTGHGEYRVVSPIILAGKSCEFNLKNVQSIKIETSLEARPRSEREESEASVHRAILRVSKPRRSIVLDETENGRTERVNQIARTVAEFLDTELDGKADAAN